MPNYRYRALNSNGELVSGAVAAAAPGEVAQRIERLGLVLVDNVTLEEGGSTRSAFSVFNKPKPEDITLFTRDLALLLRAGARINDGLELLAADRAKSNGRNLIAVRGELVPYIRLRELFAVPGEGPAIEKIVIVSHSGQRVGIVVDRVLGSHQTVIQSLGHFYRDISVVSGATIMGDGRVALIVDLSGVVNFAESVSQSISAGGGWAGFNNESTGSTVPTKKS